ncbi:MAG: methyltransferase domain-containing protein [bacterium]|nr:methyltransferase domain-containing protein [bacterium]
MFNELEKINDRPEPFQFYTAEELWTDEHTSGKMLEFHLNESIDISSRNIEFINRSVDWIHSKFDLAPSKSICDFGCGPGLYTTRFAERGAQVTGIDFSKRSIEYASNVAAEKGLKIDYIQQNYLECETDNKFDLITMIMCDYCALSPAQRKQLLQIFSNLLKPDGSVLLDVYSQKSFDQRKEQSLYEINLLDGFWSSEKYYGFLNTFKYDAEKVILDKFTIVEKNRMRVVYNWLQYFSRESLRSEIERNDFRIEKIYSDVAGSEFSSDCEEMAVILKKAR